jgi:diadenylate cyclase
MLFSINGVEINIVKVIVDFYLIGIIASFFLRFTIRSKKLFNVIFVILYLIIVEVISGYFELSGSNLVVKYVLEWLPILMVILFGSDIRQVVEISSSTITNKKEMVYTSSAAKEALIKSVFSLGKNNIGALITIEKYNNLDSYSQRAIPLNSDISYELLTNIFIPNTPLHDGAVIIRGEKILCAGAYFILSEKVDEKTTGSRHRAALGISEITDSFSIIVSEETGDVQIAFNGTQVTMHNEEQLREYLNSVIK